MIVVCGFGMSRNVYAADLYGKTYNTMMVTPDDYLFTGKERYFYAGTQSLMISFDSWNSSICKSDDDESVVAIWLYYNSQKRYTGAQAAYSHLYTCYTINWEVNEQDIIGIIFKLIMGEQVLTSVSIVDINQIRWY